MAHGSRRHAATWVHVGDQSADIDSALVPLITQVWKAGIQTDGSCEEGETTPDYAWIGFSSAEHLCRPIGSIGPPGRSWNSRCWRETSTAGGQRFGAPGLCAVGSRTRSSEVSGSTRTISNNSSNAHPK